MTQYKLTVAALALLPVLVPAHAQGEEDIVVTANRIATPVSKVGLSVTVIDREELTRLQTPSVAELLRQSVPGAAIARSGGRGGLTGVFLRGASSDHTVALIDGVKINDPSSTAGGYDFGRLMAGNIERIEVVRGPQSVLWGSQAIGGVVNVITRSADEQPSARVQAEYGYRNTVDLVGNASLRSGPITASFGAGYTRTDGISAFSERRGGTERDGQEQFGVNANLTVTLADSLSADLRGWYSRSSLDTDGGFPFGDNDSYNRTREAIGYAGLNWAPWGERWRNRISYAMTRIDRQDFDPAASPRKQSDGEGRNERWEYQGIFAIANGWNTVFGAEHERGRFSLRSDYGFGASDAGGRSRLTSFYGQLAAAPIAGLTVNLGVRHDDHNRFGGHTSLATNAAYTPNGGNTVLRASYGEGFKAPSLYQLFSEYGNGSLRPEEANSREIGLTQRALDGAVELGATWFLRKTRNLIDFVSCAGLADPVPSCENSFDGYYANVAAARAKGVEVALNVRPVDALTFSSHYSYVKSQDRSTSVDLPRRPRHKIGAALDYRWPFGLSSGVSITDISSSKDNGFSKDRNAGYTLVDLRASYPITPKIELYGRIENVFDEEYETVARYGTFGRSATIGVRWSI